MEANGAFTIKSWDENTYQELDGGGKLTKASTVTTITGDIEGENTAETLMVYPDGESATYVGYERFVGSVHGKRGSFIVQAGGGYTDGTATVDYTIVEGTGTGELAGITGEGGYVAKSGESEVQVSLRYTIN